MGSPSGPLLAKRIERSVAGVKTEISGEMVNVEFEGHNCPPEVGRMARNHGYAFLCVLGQTAQFLPDDHHRITGQ